MDFGFYNMDCMQGMKQFPDDYFDLAIVDPPYGAGLADNGGCKGWFSKYHQETAENQGGGEYWNRFGGRFDKYKHTIKERTAENQTVPGDMQIGERTETTTKKL